MKTEWDYTGLAKAYIKRPEYSKEALQQFYQLSSLHLGSRICDVGAGVAHLTLELLSEGFTVDAVEPNDDMRHYGVIRTQSWENVTWYDGVGEATGRESGVYDAVTFGSSFNVCDQQKALLEAKRLLKPKGWIALLWNHRDLNDPVQSAIEEIIKSNVSDYSYGKRREDQTEIIEQSGLYEGVHFISGSVTHRLSKEDLIEAWRSHATLARQAKDNFIDVIKLIEEYVNSLEESEIIVPYTTRMWVAQSKG